MSRLGLASFAGLLLAACSPAPQPPVPLDLRAATGEADLSPTGVAVDATGARYFFDQARGLYKQVDDARFELVLPLAAMPDPGVVVRQPFTDLVAIGRERFAITAIGDGYLLDLALGTMSQYFCYEPGDLPEPYDQRTDAVTYDPEAHLLYAQPRTFDEGGRLIASQVASYSEETGADLDWSTLALDVVAGGMAKVPGVDGLILGVNDDLCQVVGAAFSEVITLEAQGIRHIDGLAVDEVARTLLVIDGETDQLLELNLDDVFR